MVDFGGFAVNLQLSLFYYGSHCFEVSYPCCSNATSCHCFAIAVLIILPRVQLLRVNTCMLLMWVVIGQG